VLATQVDGLCPGLMQPKDLDDLFLAKETLNK
jgi:hypothetical protein